MNRQYNQYPYDQRQRYPQPPPSQYPSNDPSESNVQGSECKGCGPRRDCQCPGKGAMGITGEFFVILFSSRSISINFCIVFIYKISYSFLGPQGFPGIPGDRGLKGPVGKSGISGLAGEKGDRGQYGNKGERVSCDHFVLLHSFFFSFANNRVMMAYYQLMVKMVFQGNLVLLVHVVFLVYPAAMEAR